jgi:hypothetical protein
LDIKTFNHKAHVYVAWRYLKSMSYVEALDKYVLHLITLLTENNQIRKFSLETTVNYFKRINKIMIENPNITFNQLFDKLK